MIKDQTVEFYLNTLNVLDNCAIYFVSYQIKSLKFGPIKSLKMTLSGIEYMRYPIVYYKQTTSIPAAHTTTTMQF